MPSDDREKQFERALTRHLRGASPDASCPDPEILAAYHERTLSLDEMAHWKVHVAACSRCQETLALLEETDSVATNQRADENVPSVLRPLVARAMHEEIFDEASGPGEPAESVPLALASKASAASPVTRRHAPWRLFVPVGAIAAGLLVWVAVHEKRRGPEGNATNIQVAENRPTAAPSASLPAETRDSKRLDELAPSPLAAAPKTSKEFASKEKKDAAPARTPSAIGFAGSRGEPAVVEERSKTEADAFAAQKAMPAPAPPEPSASVTNQNLVVENSPAAPQFAPAGVTGGAIAARRSESAQQSDLEQKQTSTTEAGAARQYRAKPSSTLTAVLSKDSTADRNLIPTPDKTHTWRVGIGGKIEYTRDGGKSWELQVSNVSADLTAGSAPSQSVCWVAGKAGTVLLTTDGGKNWKRIATPIPDDLGGVHAVDAQHATIWDVPDRLSFETTDGGATWTRIANE